MKKNLKYYATKLTFKIIDHMHLSCVRNTLSDTALAGLPGSVDPLGEFIARCAQLDSPRVLELGVKRSIPDRCTAHPEFVPNASEFVGSDIEAGLDVDLVADVHELSKVAGEESFDVIITCSGYEHFKYPHLAAHEIMKTLRIGGLLFIQTHQTFPIHAYPYDYFRFSREALSGLFGTKNGFNVIATGYKFPSQIHAVEVEQIEEHPSFLNSNLFGEKTARTPEAFVYELDG